MTENKKKTQIHLDPDEAALERSFAADEWADSTNPVERNDAIAAAKLAKSERTNVRLAAEDLEGIKLKAQEKGLGYQTLIASLVHQYVAGSLVELNTAVVELALRAAKGASTGNRAVSRSSRNKLRRRTVTTLAKGPKKPRERKAQG